MTNPARPIVMVSSVIDGFEAYRTAARRAIEAAGCKPLLVNEDFPSVPLSSRNACLDAVKSGDLLLVIQGKRGGWVTPSGKTVVEEEVEYASDCNKPILYFSVSDEKDETAERLHTFLSDYVTGLFRQAATTPHELELQVTQALQQYFKGYSKNRYAGSFMKELFEDVGDMRNSRDTFAQLVLEPVREGELYDILNANDQFATKFLVDFFGKSDFLNPLSKIEQSISSKKIVFCELGGQRQEMPRCHFTAYQTGTLVLTKILDIGGIHQDDSGKASNPEGQIAEAISKFMIASNAVYDYFDKFKRFDIFMYNVRLNSRGIFVPCKNQFGHGTSYSQGPAGDFYGYESPRTLSRNNLLNDQEQARAVKRLWEQAGPQQY